MQQLTRNIFFEEDYLGVTVGALVFPHGTILIDAPLRGEDARSWRSMLINQRGGPNKLMISLDAHPDRTLGARALDCTIIAHQKAAQAFRSRPSIFKGQTVETGADWENYTESVGMRWASPDITFSERLTLHWGGSEVIVEHRPGPSAGSIWVEIPEARVVFVGDMVVMKQPPFLAQAEFEPWLANLEILATNYQDYSIVCGRGGLAKTTDVRLLQSFIQETMQKLDHLAEKKAAPEELELLLPDLLLKYKAAVEKQEHYAERLTYGIYHAYLRRSKIADALIQLEAESEDQ